MRHVDDIKRNIEEILKQNAKLEDIEDNYNKNSFSMWKKLANKWLKDSKTYNKFKSFLFATQIFVSGASIMVVILVREIHTMWMALLVWMGYALINVFVSLVYRYYPDDYENLSKEVKEIKLIALTERLAAKLALFERLNEHDVKDDREIIEQISYRVKDFNELSDDITEVIKRSIDPNARFTTSRDTNITLEMEDYELTTREKVDLNNVTKVISEIAQKLFGGKGYSAKLYLRVIKNYNNEDVEVLVPFSRFPTKENFGSSWIKSRGNLSSVWECLERGEDKVVDFSKEDLYYKSILTICLPGRIGVITVHNEETEFFLGNVHSLDYKALSMATKQMIMEALQINS